MLTSCEKGSITENDAGLIKVTAKAAVEGETKTTISGNTLTWVTGDKFGVYVNGIQTNIPFNNTSGNSFTGYFKQKGKVMESASFRAYYPRVPYMEGNVISTELPSQQRAPFDPAADYVLSPVITADYDEGDMPELNYNFKSHFFSFVKVTVRNTDPDFAREPLLGITLKCDGCVLAGKFSFNIFDDGPVPLFSTLQKDISDSVSVGYSEEKEAPELGLNVDHVFYAVINPVTTTKLSLTVNTLQYEKTFESKVEFSASCGTVTPLPAVTLTKGSMTKKFKTLLYWGDSIGPKEVTNHLQSLLGPDWKVIRCAIGGDNAWDIAGRQGGIPMCLKNHYVIPGDSSQKIQVSGIFSTWDNDGNYNPSKGKKLNKYTWFDEETYGVRLNPCEIEGVKCRFTYDSSTDKLYLQRMEDGDPVDVPAYSIVHSYASLHYRDADVSAIYMGTNGRNNDTDELLASQYDAMIDFISNKNYIVEGFHWRETTSRAYPGWTEKFQTIFNGRYGERFLDLRCYGSANAERLLVETGVYQTASDIPALDRALISIGDWPASWQYDYTSNVHPNPYGSKAIAIMVYEKMRSLGYLNE